MEKADTYRMLKIKEGEVKGKIGNLRQEMDQEFIKNRLKARAEEMGGCVDANYYSIDHPRTKEA